ncbi:MAG: hypothetical protein CL472_08340, partial [Acidobacteria bacterium]|nr:hypothetical protein [Acidobacteriota bacterium]
MIRTLLAIAALALTLPVSAKTDPSFFSELNGKAIIDDAQIIEDGAEAELNQKLVDFSDEYGRQMVIITVPTLDGNDIATFTLDYARHLGVGSKELDDGLVLLVAPNEREIRIEVGYGLEWWMTDYQSAAAIDVVKPYFREGDYTGGITAVTDKILPEITPAAEQKAADEAARDAERARENAAAMRTFFDWVMIIIAVIAFIFGSLWASKIPERRRKKRAQNWNIYLEVILENPIAAPAALSNTATLKKRYKEAYDEEQLRRTVLKAAPEAITKLPDATRQERMIAIRNMPGLITALADPTRDELRQAIIIRPSLIAHFKDDRDLVDLALSENGMTLAHIANPTEEQIKTALLENPEAIIHIDSPADEHRRIALTRDGNLIFSLANVTAAERLIAINSRPEIVEKLSSLTDEEIETALQADPGVLQYVIEYVSDQQINAAVQKIPSLITLLDSPSAKLQKIAIEYDENLARQISNPT